MITVLTLADAKNTGTVGFNSWAEKSKNVYLNRFRESPLDFSGD